MTTLIFFLRRNGHAGFLSCAACVMIFCNQTLAQTTSADSLKKLSLEELMNLEVVSVSKRSEKLVQAPSAIQVITQQDIRHSGATNVPEALRLAPNLQVAQVNSSQWAISARGFNNVLANKLLVLIDGRVVYTPMYSGVFWDVQNLLLEDVERIEVISGPGGTMWGANAVNGVINIITKKASATQGLFAEAATGNSVKGLASVRYGGELTSNLSYRVYGTAYKRDNTFFQDSTEANDDWTMAQGGARLDWNPRPADMLMFQGNLYDGRPDPDSGNPIIARGTNLTGRWNHTCSERSDFQVQLYYDQTWRDFRNNFTENLKTYDLEGQHRFHLGKAHEIIYGLGLRYMDHKVENLELFAFKPARKALYLFNVFLQDDITLIEDRLRLTVGLKLEHNSYTGYQYQPNARLNFSATRQQIFWASVSRAVRNPARIDREFYLYLTPELPFIAGSNSRSEEVIAYEFGWRFQPVEEWNFSLSGFYNQYDNIRSVEPGPPPFGIPVTFGNGVRGDSYGLEFSATGQVEEWWRIRAGYTYLKKELEVKPGSLDSNQGSAESNDPNHQFLIQSQISVSDRLEFGTLLRYTGRLPQPYVSDYTGLDLRFAWKIVRELELNLVGQNIISKRHVEFVPATAGAREVERSVYVKLVCRL